MLEEGVKPAAKERDLSKSKRGSSSVTRKTAVK